MHNRSVVLAVIFLMAFWFMGCSSSPAPSASPVPPTLEAIPYNFVENDNADGTAIIYFHLPPNAPFRFRLIDIDGVELPAPEVNTRWSPVQVPAGRALNISMYVVYHSDQPGYRRLGVFRCPPLEAGKIYRLWYERWYEIGLTNTRYEYSGAGRLILTYADVERLTYATGGIFSEKSFSKRKPLYNQIYVQEIPPLTKGRAE